MRVYDKGLLNQMTMPATTVNRTKLAIQPRVTPAPTVRNLPLITTQPVKTESKVIERPPPPPPPPPPRTLPPIPPTTPPSQPYIPREEILIEEPQKEQTDDEMIEPVIETVPPTDAPITPTVKQKEWWDELIDFVTGIFK